MKKSLENWKHDFIQKYNEEKLNLFKSMVEDPTISLNTIGKEFNVSRETVRQWAMYYEKDRNRIKERKLKRLSSLPFNVETINIFVERCRDKGLKVEPIFYNSNSGKACVSVKAILVNNFKCLPKKLGNPTTTGGPKQYFRIVFPKENFDFLCLIDEKNTYILPYEKLVKDNKPVMLYIPFNQISKWSHIDWNKYKEKWDLLEDKNSAVDRNGSGVAC